MQDFAAIDFETANNERSSVCSVGIVIVRGGKIVGELPKSRISCLSNGLSRLRVLLHLHSIIPSMA